MSIRLLLLPQRYVFSSKSQPIPSRYLSDPGCCCYHKGTYFQANHNRVLLVLLVLKVVVATTKVRIFKQITTEAGINPYIAGCCCYHKGTYFQANHNNYKTTYFIFMLLLLPQRYVFSSKSQHIASAFHNTTVVVATTKVRIFKQITTIHKVALFC